jgi:uncharacterized protein (TIGR00369 family)
MGGSALMSNPAESLAEDIAAARRGEDPQRLLAALPYAAFLGAEAQLVEGQLRLTLPFRQELVGNIFLPAIHGGALASLAELAAIATLLWQQESFVLPKTVTTTVDFGRSAGPKTTLAQGRVGRLGRRIATVAVSLWQDSPARPVASAQTHFLLG